MSTALAVAVLIVLVLGAVAAAIVALRLLKSPPPSPSLSGSPEDDLSLRSTLAGSRPATVRHEETPEPVPSREGASADPAWDPSKESEEDAPTTYDPHRESEDDVPTTLFRDEDSQELAEYIADFDRETKDG